MSDPEQNTPGQELANPPNFGIIRVANNDTDQLKFWIRMFALEQYIELARLDLSTRPEVKRASAPVISEHQSGKLYWFYAIVLDIDALGLVGGVGFVTFADKTNCDQAQARRNKVSDMILRSFSDAVQKGAMTGTTVFITPSDEKEIGD